MVEQASNKHRIWTLEDIAVLPADARPRLLKELPDIIESVSGWIGVLEKTALQLPEEKRQAFLDENRAKMPGMVTWVDDGRADRQVTVTGKDEDGSSRIFARGDSRTRDLQLLVDGEDRTHDAMLAHKLRGLGIVVTEQNHAAVLPDGQIVLDSDMLTKIERHMSPAGFADLADAANRKIIIVDADPGRHDVRWKHHADIQ